MNTLMMIPIIYFFCGDATVSEKAMMNQLTGRVKIIQDLTCITLMTRSEDDDFT